jgi:6-phosphogluconolactonase
VLLGLGDDGHTASLFPGAPLEIDAPTLAVEAPAGDRSRWRVSLAPAVFNSSRRVVFLVQGAGKSKIVASVLYGKSTPEQLPAQRIRPDNGDLIWMLDTGAAASS